MTTFSRLPNLLKFLLIHKNKSSNKPGKLKTGNDASDNDTEEDSDFEDPDEIEVPGGGKDLDTIIKVTGNPTKPNPGPSPGNNLFSTTSTLSILNLPIILKDYAELVNVFWI